MNHLVFNVIYPLHNVYVLNSDMFKITAVYLFMFGFDNI